MTRLNKKIFGILFFSIFTAVTGVGIVVPLLPVYAHDLGASGFYIGLIFGAFSLSRTFLLPYFGRLSDRKGRKPLIVAGLFIYALISLAFIFSKNVEALISIRFIQGIASAMMMPALQAYVGDITPEGKEGFTMGLFNMSMFFGLSLGPLMGGMINDRFSLHAAFVSMGILAMIGFLLSFCLLPRTSSEKVLKHQAAPAEWKTFIKDREIVGLFIFRFAYVATIGIIWGFLPVYADARFSLSSSAIGLLVMIGILSSGAIHVPMGYLADVMNRRIMVFVGGVIVSISVLSYVWAEDFTGLFLSGVIFGIGGGISMPALMAVVVIKGNKTGAMGAVMALMTLAHSLGMLAGSMVAGLMMDYFELTKAFPTGAMIMLFSTGIFYFCTHRMGSEKK